MSLRNAIILGAAALLLGFQIQAMKAQQAVKGPNPGTDWPMFSHDLAGTRFSPLKQINAGNVGKLKLAWSMPYRADRTGAAAGGLGGVTGGTPGVGGGRVYFPPEKPGLAIGGAP